MSFEDKVIKCRDCGKEFTFSAREQQRFAELGFTNLPTRCRECREKRKRSAEVAANKVLYKITCKNCGKEGEMATEPRKPNDVLCSECFYEAFRHEHGDVLDKPEAEDKQQQIPSTS